MKIRRSSSELSIKNFRVTHCGKQEKIPEVVDAHYTTGNYSIFAKIICRDTEHLRDILSRKLQAIKGIQRTETFISLEETLSRPLILADID